MITLSKSGNTVTFTFDENSGYLQNGTIDVPVNSLSLILDESDMATFRKSASNDIFVSANIAEFDMSKSELEAWYKANMVGSSGGGGTGGTTPEEVQQMIDESISGKADSSSLATVATSGSYSDLINKPIVSTAITSGDTNAVAGGAVYDQVTVNAEGEVFISSAQTSAWDYTLIAFPSGTTKFTLASFSNDQITKGGTYVDIYDSTDTKVSTFDKISTVDSTYATVDGAVGDTLITFTANDGYYFKGSSDNGIYLNGATVISFYRLATISAWLKDVVTANTIAIEGKQDTLSAGTNITISGNVISAEGGGKAVVAGRGISVTTGATADTVSINLPISGGSGNYSLKVGNPWVSANGYANFAGGYQITTQNYTEFGYGQYNQSNKASNSFGVSGNTLFAIGNGDSNSARHNAFEIRQNGDIYIVDTSSSGEYFDKQMIKLQDSLGGTVSSAITSGDTNAVAGGAVYDKFDEVEQVTARALIDVNDKFGGLKLEQITQADYDALSGNTDSNTLYVIVN